MSIKGQRIALLHERGPLFVAALQEVWEREGVATLLPPNHPQLASLLEELEVHEVWDERGRSLLKGGRLCPEVGTLLLTSGSTGKQKAVYHTLEAHCASARGVNRRLFLTKGDSWLLNLPAWHVSGLSIIVRCLLSGASLRFSGDTTHASMVSTQLIRLLQKGSFPSYKALLVGGGPLPKEVWDHGCRAGLPLYFSYGMTEMASTITIADKGDGNDVGSLLEGREIRVADGEIRVRGSTLFSGFWTQDGLKQPFCKEGWYATGDYGRLASGRLHFMGRRDAMFVSGGENIHPEEIERALLKLDGVQRALVLPMADPEFGEVAVALVDSLKSPPHLTECLRRVLPRHKIPKRFFCWDKVYQTNYGKVDRRKTQLMINRFV
jgi:O-succinylbenzoic acid--CoA ligase